MEAIELYHAEHIELPLRLACYEEIRHRQAVVDPARLPSVAGSRFHPHLPLLWIEACDLFSERAVWIPYEVVSMNYTLPMPPGSGCFASSSNGLASGNHLLEALSHAICEVVERDAVTTWGCLGAQARRRTRLDLSTVDDTASLRAIGCFEQARVTCVVWDATGDVGLACFVCLIVDRESSPFRAVVAAGGMGCHPDRDVALLRALTEAAQSRLTVIAGSRDDQHRGRYRRSTDSESLGRAGSVRLRRAHASREPCQGRAGRDLLASCRPG
jgi:ribosomal protein S12 methylthiotransferase accessory factor